MGMYEDIADKYGNKIKPNTIARRMRAGMSEEVAATKPPQTKPNKNHPYRAFSTQYYSEKGKKNMEYKVDESL